MDYFLKCLLVGYALYGILKHISNLFAGLFELEGIKYKTLLVFASLIGVLSNVMVGAVVLFICKKLGAI